MSKTAFLAKDTISLKESVSIVDCDKAASSVIAGHTEVGGILLDRPEGDDLIRTPDGPGHLHLRNIEQALVLRAMTEDTDLTRHLQDALPSRRICLAADKSVRSGQGVLR